MKKALNSREKEKSAFDFLSSVTLSLVLVPILAASVFGTLYPEANVYHSWWFLFLLTVLSVNLIACTFRRLSAKSRHWGTVAIHLAVILILLGGLASALTNKKGFIGLFEGEAKKSAFITETEKFILPFYIRLDAFETEYYPTGQVKEWRSRVTIFDEETNETVSQTIRVNAPMSYRGWSIYQSSYDEKYPHWAGLIAKRDVSMYFIWPGFVLLFFGLVFHFYVKLLLKSKPAVVQEKEQGGRHE